MYLASLHIVWYKPQNCLNNDTVEPPWMVTSQQQPLPYNRLQPFFKIPKVQFYYKFDLSILSHFYVVPWVAVVERLPSIARTAILKSHIILVKGETKI